MEREIEMDLSEDNSSYMLWVRVPKESRYVRGLLKLVTTLGVTKLSKDEQRIVDRLTASWKKLLRV